MGPVCRVVFTVGVQFTTSPRCGGRAVVECCFLADLRTSKLSVWPLGESGGTLGEGNSLRRVCQFSTPKTGRTWMRPGPVQERKKVRVRGLEPPPGCPDMALNHARLPVPPHPLFFVRLSVRMPQFGSMPSTRLHQARGYPISARFISANVRSAACWPLLMQCGIPTPWKALPASWRRSCLAK